MPPKKKSRVSTAAAAAAPSPPPPSSKETPAETSQDEDEGPTQAEIDAMLVADPWTDDEEIGLFKALIKWKPTGMHKHFHIVSLQQYLLTNGYIHPGAPHTRIPGIWAKLRSLYDLDALDERENANALPWSPSTDDDEADELGGEDDEDEAEAEEDEFELPEDEFGEMIWKQRFPNDDDAGSEREESPAAADELVGRADSPPIRFTPSFEIAPSEEKPTPSRRSKTAAIIGSAKGKPKPGSRASAVAAAVTRRSSRVADSVDPEEDDEDEDEAEESDGESGPGSTASGTPAPRGRARPAARSKPVKGRAKRKR